MNVCVNNKNTIKNLRRIKFKNNLRKYLYKKPIIRILSKDNNYNSIRYLARIAGITPISWYNYHRSSIINNIKVERKINIIKLQNAKTHGKIIIYTK